MDAVSNMGAIEAQIAPWLNGRTFDSCWQQFQEEGYIIFENVLTDTQLAAQQAALDPWIARDLRGRNDFEGAKSNRVYAMLAKDPIFADLIHHPLQLAFGERELGETMLLYACLAINLHPGETPQPWHFDDSHCGLTRPRAPLSMSTFWSIDAMTDNNGATEIIPGSHKWGDETPNMATKASDFVTGSFSENKGDGSDNIAAIKAIMPAGSLMIAKGTLWHRGGGNDSDNPRMIVTPQFCAGWCRPLEQQILAVPKEKVAQYPKRVRELLGFNIHTPFMGYVDGMHPEKVLS